LIGPGAVDPAPGQLASSPIFFYRWPAFRGSYDNPARCLACCDPLTRGHATRKALNVLRRQHGVSLESAWEKLATDADEDTALYDAWIEHRGLSAALQAVESEIAGIRHGDFSFA